jgi:hypothetical protein
MSTEWSGVTKVTLTKYTKGAEDHTLKNYKWLALLKQKGRITFNHAGKDLQWQVEMKQHTVQDYGDDGVINFARMDPYELMSVDWRGYVAADRMTKKEKLMNRGPQALIERYSTIGKRLIKSIRDKFSAELYVDGHATGFENRLCGIESFMGSGTTVAADLIAQPSDTYGSSLAAKSTALANKGGSWTADRATPPNAAVATDWPYGTGDDQYHYISPKLVNYKSTSWGTGSTTWEDNGERAMREMIMWCVLNSGKEGMLDLINLEPSLYTTYSNSIAPKQRINVDQNTPLRALGFKDTHVLDGVEITSEYGIGATKGYGLNFDEMELCSLNDELFFSDGPNYDPATLSWLYAVGFFGNLKFNPKAFGKLDDYA